MGKTAQDRRLSVKRKRQDEFSRSVNGATFTPFRHDLARSEEFKNLSPTAVKVFTILLGKYNGKNNGDLSAPLNQSKEVFNLSDKSLQKGINELIKYKFIELTRQGGKNQCNLYALTCLPINSLRSKIDLIPSQRPSDKWKKAN
ncbi:ArsR family transcriptional regulator [Pasteurella skyensis]|uniref:ArsR family transcriptional regulator n=1 Tax=Phocoenobacter skyensis TaxID=97481 RepID=A0AAJ6N9F6_9PAST|nr:ArsR family transcriptional regulator [Pasteurella skyensis]MDP8162195.1 ArsR family transcriptional regulator [Pasteurella skyensis]MDP8172659.1 ArsR family transcriptional regulator [Pasteurella skyensis]MDP8176821.1 ArsR family transcriptional regulator [Pasteurella skyensis]MDP8179159.1 ArsR family transcriptional regulator [Pasteurella skyensis]MDP8183386.1 ArsR family transcriptional regulator [Pasteurella skyensis]